MAKVPGTFNYDKYSDLRLLMVEPIANWYKERNLWDSIVGCRFYDRHDVITRRTKLGRELRDKWAYGDRGPRLVETKQRIDGEWIETLRGVVK